MLKPTVIAINNFIFLVIGTSLLIFGAYDALTVRQMMRKGISSHQMFLGHRPEYTRNKQPGMFWGAVAFNAFVSTCALSMALVVLSIVIPTVATILAK